jgi:hypothetical protein
MSDEIDLGIDGIGPATLVGRGGFGRVYRAVQASSGGAVAVKIAAGHLDATGRERFEREARALGALRGHPNICTVFDAGVDADERPYLVMEYAPSTLAQGLADDGAMAWQEAAALGVQLAGALHTAHARGLLHRDVKPENVLISQFGVPKLADFGLARFTDDTLSGTITTTISHAAPELLRGGPPTVATDVYALGSTLFAALTGHVAFALTDQAHPASLYRRIDEDPVPEMPGVPDAIAQVVRNAMAKDPSRRPDSAAALGEALRDAQRREGAAVTPLPLAADEPATRPAPPLPVTAESATPHQGAGEDALTEAIVRGNREPVVLEESPGSPDDVPGRRVPRWVPAAALVGAVLIAILAVALTGGDGDPTTSGTTSTTTIVEESTTTLSPEAQLAADLPLIRQFWEDFSEASLTSAAAEDAFIVRNTHPMMGSRDACGPFGGENAEAEFEPSRAVLDESAVAPSPDWRLPYGPHQGEVPTGRLYVTPVAFEYRGLLGDPVDYNVAIVQPEPDDPPVVYSQWAC